MSTAGQRKAALYLASLASDDQAKLLAALPAATALAVRPLVAQVVANGWDDRALVSEALAEEIRGLTVQSSLSIDVILGLAKQLPADWTARLFAANSALDSRFLTALLDAPLDKQVHGHLAAAPRLPERLRHALLAEAQVGTS